MLIFAWPFFLVIGLRTMVFGKLPSTLFRYLLDGGEYKLSPISARLFGLFILSPVIAGSVGAQWPQSIYATIQISYMVMVTLVSIFIASRIRRPQSDHFEDSPANDSRDGRKPIKVLGRLLLVLLAAAQIMAVATALFGGVWMLMPAVIFSMLFRGTSPFTGDFGTDVLITLLLLTILEFAALCIYWSFTPWFKRPSG